MSPEERAEFHASRCGKVTASRIVDVMAKGKSGEALTRAGYKAELLSERDTGVQPEGFSSAAMQWGTDCEPLACAAYESETGQFVTKPPLIDHPSIALSGASPDGLVGNDGLIEIKCPNTHTHIAHLLSAAIKRDYMLQMQWQMACTDRLWCDFASFDPRLSPAKQLKITRVMRDQALIDEIEAEVNQFQAELEAMMLQLNAMYPNKAA